jgi:hypothetical protein
MTSRTLPTKIKLSATGSNPIWLKQFTLAAIQKGLAPYFGLEGQGFVYQPPLRRALEIKVQNNNAFTDEEHNEYARWSAKDGEIREKSSKCLVLLEEYTDSDVFERIIDANPDWQIMTPKNIKKIMLYIKENYGGVYNTLVDRINRDLMHKIPNFDTESIFLKAIDDYRLLKTQEPSINNLFLANL